VRSFDAAAFRQAAQMLDQVDAAHLAALSPLEQARKLSAQARGFLDRGLLLEAERLYQSAVAADGNCAEAHTGMAQVRERTGDAADARMEANQALELSLRRCVPGARTARSCVQPPERGQQRRRRGSQAGAASQAAQELARQIQAKRVIESRVSPGLKEHSMLQQMQKFAALLNSVAGRLRVRLQYLDWA